MLNFLNHPSNGSLLWNLIIIIIIFIIIIIIIIITTTTTIRFCLFQHELHQNTNMYNDDGRDSALREK